MLTISQQARPATPLSHPSTPLLSFQPPIPAPLHTWRSVMNVIKVLAKVEEANQLGRQLPPEAFYNELIRCGVGVGHLSRMGRMSQAGALRGATRGAL